MTVLAIGFRFLAGRYHATPWGRHVNEADVEWPPSVWRLVRALVATWHRKAARADFSESDLEELITELASSLPIYQLPPAVHAHTRHYMPVRAGSAHKPALIFDAFASVARSDELVVGWPGLALTGKPLELLDHLLENLGFLGRAESWVEARRVLDWNPALANCLPDRGEVEGEREEAREPVQLLQPMSEEAYKRWRDTAEAGVMDGIKTQARKRAIRRTLPARVIDAVTQETTMIQGAGWTRPPGAVKVLYERPFRALGSTRIASPKPDQRTVRSVRIVLAGKPLPRLERAVRIGELTRIALMHLAKREFGPDQIPPQLTGHGLRSDRQHDHAFYLPEDADGDGRIDHVLIYVPAGLTVEALRLFRRFHRLFEPGGSEWQVLVEGVSLEGDVSQALSPLETNSRTWASVTPYLHPWHAKKTFGVAEQIARECRTRSLPVPSVEVVPEILVRGRPRRPTHFHRFRSKRGLVQPDTRGRFLRLTFPEPVPGPLALGFGCHFGLGLFVPVKE